MSFTTLDYLNLITSQYRQKPNFIAMVDDGASAAVDLQNVFASMIPKFDLDSSVGQQLDVIGQWVGISRNIPVPIPGVYFSWDSTYDLGWDFGVWISDDAPSEVTILPDDVYRTFVKAKIAANTWDGTLEGLYQVWDSVFTDITIFIKDNQNMSYDIGFFGRPVDSLTLALIQQGYLPLKPEGVRVNIIYSPIDDNKLFAFDVETSVLAGWDDGSWAREIT